MAGGLEVWWLGGAAMRENAGPEGRKQLLGEGGSRGWSERIEIVGLKALTDLWFRLFLP